MVDEADRMMDLGFEAQLRSIISKLGERQSVFFSATWPSRVQKLVKDFCESPVRVSFQTANRKVRQEVVVCTELEKKKLFFEWLEKAFEKNKILNMKMLVFVETRRAAEALCKQLHYEQYSARSLHGDRDQEEREKVLESFRSGECEILVATDVAQRGLDIKDVNYVVNYSMPKTIEDYVHRIGRTGRAGASGTAVSFLSSDFRASESVRLASGLLKAMEDAGQAPPEALIRLAKSENSEKALPNGCPRLFHAEKGWGFLTSDEIKGVFQGKAW